MLLPTVHHHCPVSPTALPAFFTAHNTSTSTLPSIPHNCKLIPPPFFFSSSLVFIYRFIDPLVLFVSQFPFQGKLPCPTRLISTHNKGFVVPHVFSRDQIYLQCARRNHMDGRKTNALFQLHKVLLLYPLAPPLPTSTCPCSAPSPWLTSIPPSKPRFTSVFL